MNAIIVYCLKVNIAIALFYLFYRLFFANDTFWKTRRFYLLFSILLSLTYPFLSIETWLEKQETIKTAIMSYNLLPEITVNAGVEAGFWNAETILSGIYMLVVSLLLVRMTFQLLSILNMRLRGKKALVQDVEVIVLTQKLTPFSFFSSVFLNPSLHNERETREILAHELTHVRQGHSYDVLISEVFTILFWYNPASWLMKRDMRQNLEFLADNHVISSGFDSKIYQYHLLQLSYQMPEVTLGNKFNVSPLKKRITMMNQQKSSKAGLLKYALIVPLALALIISSNAQTIVNKAKKVVDAKPSTTKVVNKKPEAILIESKTNIPAVEQGVISETPNVSGQNNDNKVYEVIEKMPEFPGGDNALIQYLTSNIKYPVLASEKGIQGRVIVRFIVGADGTVRNAEVVRSVESTLDAEAVRVVNSMPKWTPGEQNNEKVAVYYALPISFKLQGNDTKTQKVSGAMSNALIVVDDVVMPAGFDIKTIKPENIATIDVLKDASATAVYGEKGKNGVVVIRTKK